MQSQEEVMVFCCHQGHDLAKSEQHHLALKLASCKPIVSHIEWHGTETIGTYFLEFVLVYQIQSWLALLEAYLSCFDQVPKAH